MKQFVAFVKKHQPELIQTEIFQDLIKWNRDPKGVSKYRPNGIWQINEVIEPYYVSFYDRFAIKSKMSNKEYTAATAAQEAFDSKMEETRRAAADIYKLLHQFVYKNKDKYVIYIGSGNCGWTGFHIMTRNFIESVGDDEFHKLEDSSTIYTCDRYITERNGVTIIIENKHNIYLKMGGIDFAQIP